ncbi:MAG: hypothetical protein J6P06_01260 [Aeriscardovia sp.]|nr:hypothetical protein [Aeriscardovia sp.]
MADDKNQGTEPQAQEPKVEWVAVLVLSILAVAILIVGFSVYMARKINEYQDQQKMAEKQAEEKQAAQAAKIFTKVIDMKATANGPAVATVDINGTKTSYTFTNNWTKTEDVKVSQDLEKYDATQDAVVVSVKAQSPSSSSSSSSSSSNSSSKSSSSSSSSSSKVSIDASESGKTIAQSSGSDHATLSVTVGDVAK